MKYYSPFMNSAHDVLPMFPFFVVMNCAGFHWLNVKEYPVFKPNEYFWKKHYDPTSGKEKWEVFAETVRKIMQESFGFKLVDHGVEEKAQYKSKLLGKLYKPD
mmetsp:Transcript_1429/g.928  ORF Transcript_1429/g.928 Transcript_1429/m.928 type:complete len:103 (-) Transcript_1429:40-348(-)|eukprot:CAMPEP_0202963112 /NCGR_PEP_ID=MMETSP1396-20130829/7113_1 /ASSEMBLY_ACC=CAM_ASM_000872 /TAXON_ID= /ORGANISM="Pseudokeronopsis sp., Strain Brazil" /LENGTH=102 /DNA_ID=CAMNT_0049684077 /DNA_START=804 /DNA_END=1112 /DNA_ORIENTATION=+